MGKILHLNIYIRKNKYKQLPLSQEYMGKCKLLYVNDIYYTFFIVIEIVITQTSSVLILVLLLR